MLKPMHPDKAKELRETLKALRAKLGEDNGRHLKERKGHLHPVLAEMSITKEEVPVDIDHPDTAHEDETKVKGDGEHKKLFAEGGEAHNEVEYPEKKERPAPPMPKYASGGTVESDHDSSIVKEGVGHMDDDKTIETHKKLLERLLRDY